ncbi:MAG TPA: hypothetical protein VMT00_08925 [Thermoanaerobaculia bacterium]|nr:hypothetical protein [Thermoanaerobaculia bacterium]
MRKSASLFSLSIIFALFAPALGVASDNTVQSFKLDLVALDRLSDSTTNFAGQKYTAKEGEVLVVATLAFTAPANSKFAITRLRLLDDRGSSFPPVKTDYRFDFDSAKFKSPGSLPPGAGPLLSTTLEIALPFAVPKNAALTTLSASVESVTFALPSSHKTKD